MDITSNENELFVSLIIEEIKKELDDCEITNEKALRREIKNILH